MPYAISTMKPLIDAPGIPLDFEMPLAVRQVLNDTAYDMDAVREREIPSGLLRGHVDMDSVTAYVPIEAALDEINNVIEVRKMLDWADLTERQRTVIKLHLMIENSWTLEEIGKDELSGVSRSRAREIETSALMKMANTIHWIGFWADGGRLGGRIECYPFADKWMPRPSQCVDMSLRETVSGNILSVQRIL